MTQITHPRPLCPHLAAASLWMTKHTQITRRGKAARVAYARTLGAAADELLAL